MKNKKEYTLEQLKAEFIRGFKAGERKGQEEFLEKLQDIFGITKCHCDSCNNY